MKKFLSSAAVLAALFAAAPASALQLQPMSRIFAPSGSGATQSFEVTNDTGERIAVEISIVTLARDEDYAEINHEADDEFLVYPPQLVLAAGRRQTVRVTWLGDPRPLRELTYRIVVRQIPIEDVEQSEPAETPTGHVRLLMTFRGTLYVRPKDAAPRVTVEAAAALVTAGGVPAVAVTLENSGTAGAIVTGCVLELVSGERTLEVPAGARAALANTRVLAGARRRYVLPWSGALPGGPLAAKGTCHVKP